MLYLGVKPLEVCDTLYFAIQVNTEPVSAILIPILKLILFIIYARYIIKLLTFMVFLLFLC